MAAIASPVQQIKCVILGDPTVGKTSLLRAHIPDDAEGSEARPQDKQPPTNNVAFSSYKGSQAAGSYYPTLFSIKHEKAAISATNMAMLGVWDGPAHSDYDRIRPLLYNKIDVAVICFALNDSESFENIDAKWIKEVRYHSPDAHVLIVGTKRDLPAAVSVTQAKSYAMKIGATGGYFMTSTAKGEEFGVVDLFDTVIKVGLSPKRPQLSSVRMINGALDGKRKKLFGSIRGSLRRKSKARAALQTFSHTADESLRSQATSVGPAPPCPSSTLSSASVAKMLQAAQLSAEAAARHAYALRRVWVRKEGDACTILLMYMLRDGQLTIRDAESLIKEAFGLDVRQYCMFKAKYECETWTRPVPPQPKSVKKTMKILKATKLDEADDTHLKAVEAGFDDDDSDEDPLVTLSKLTEYKSDSSLLNTSLTYEEDLFNAILKIEADLMNGDDPPDSLDDVEGFDEEDSEIETFGFGSALPRPVNIQQMSTVNHSALNDLKIEDGDVVHAVNITEPAIMDVASSEDKFNTAENWESAIEHEVADGTVMAKMSEETLTSSSALQKPSPLAASSRVVVVDLADTDKVETFVNPMGKENIGDPSTSGTEQSSSRTDEWLGMTRRGRVLPSTGQRDRGRGRSHERTLTLPTGDGPQEVSNTGTQSRRALPESPANSKPKVQPLAAPAKPTASPSPRRLPAPPRMSGRGRHGRGRGRSSGRGMSINNTVIS